MPATQEGRPLRIDTPLGANALLLDAFEGEEAISTPFRYEVRMLSENPNVSADALLRKPVWITVDLKGGPKIIHGIVNRFVQTGRRHTYTAYQATIVPWLWLLGQKRDCKIFQRMTGPDIVEKVFKDFGFTDYKLDLRNPDPYPKREYCVQYRETALNFVSRLLEEEGISYYFEHTTSKHTLVLTDLFIGVKPCPGHSKFAMAPEGVSVLPEDVVTQLDYEKRLCEPKIVLGDYNFETPSNDLTQDSGIAGKDEIYDYPGEYGTKTEGSHYAKVRQEQEEASSVVIRGTSNCRSMVTGYTFDLRQHYRADLNKTHMLTSLRQAMESNSYGTNPNARADYTNEFEASTLTPAYRAPRRAVKPLVQGPQTAVVVGPKGEEIYTDKFGRIKVQFFWDRVGKKNEDSSCWIRVSQEWAGKNWGSIHIPRIGQEVIVDFLEGDPDRPIITGRVYNAEQTVPYALPSNMTQSGMKTRSTKGGSGETCNELRFEDKKGSELILFHAEKDLTTEVENDEIRTVGNDRTTTIQRHDTKTLKCGNETTTLDMGNQSTTLKMGNKTTKINLGKSEMEALQSIELKVGQSSIKLDQTGVTIKGMMIKIDGLIQVDVHGLMTNVKADTLMMVKGAITMIN